MIHCFNINEIKLDYIVIYSIKLLLNNYNLNYLIINVLLVQYVIEEITFIVFCLQNPINTILFSSISTKHFPTRVKCTYFYIIVGQIDL